MTEQETKPKKTRTVKPGEYRVYVNTPGGWAEAGTGGTHADTAAGLKWVREHGEANRTYMVARVCWTGQVEEQTKTVRKLA